MTRRRVAACGALLLLAGAAGASLAGADQTRSQTFFRDRLLADARTSEEIKELLEDGGGFVDRAIVFRDLTDDGRDDALVRVHSGGAMGVVAVYVLSTAGGREGSSDLRVVYRQQRLTRASTSIRRGVLSFRTSAYAAGDELCCPSSVEETTLRWDRRRRAFRVASRREVVAEPTPTPTATQSPAGE